MTRKMRFGLYVAAAILIVFGLWDHFSCASRAVLQRVARTYPGCLYFCETEQPLAALTIDDSPDSATTHRILEVLDEHQARATFFVISSRVPGNEEVLRKIVARGHEIGNHLTRDEPSIELAPAEFERALHEADSVLTRFSEVRWFRPGSGRYNARMIAVLGKYGYQCALGSVYPFDAAISSAWFSEHYILQNVRPGAIIVLHDDGDRGERTVQVLERILPELRSRGLKLVTLTQLFEAAACDSGPQS